MHNEAQAVCKELGITNDKFNQDANAATTLRALAKVKTVEEKLQVAYLGGNASALRQAISTTKTTKAAEIGSKLISMVKA